MNPTHLYRDLAIVFAAALGGGLVARRLRVPLILGYVLAGILIGPFTPGPRLSDLHLLELLAEIGVIFLMFSIGVEFSLHELSQVKRIALLGGPLGILLHIGLTMGMGRFLGWNLQQGFAIGAALCVASTMVMSRLLIDQGKLQSSEGRIMIGITLVEDFAVILLIVTLPALVKSSPMEHLTSLAMDLGKALIILVPILFLATRWIPKLMARIAKMRNPELYILVILTLSLMTAALTQALGLSLALGAFLGGMMISGTRFVGETLTRVQPLRDMFVALFFVTIGTLIDPHSLITSPGLLAFLVFLIVVGKFIVWFLVVRVFGYPTPTALEVGLGLTQIGEFSYVLIRVARDEQLIGNDIYNAVLAASLLTILLNATLMRLVPRGRWASG